MLKKSSSQSPNKSAVYWMVYTAITTILAIFLRSTAFEVLVSAIKIGRALNGLTIANRAITSLVYLGVFMHGTVPV